MVNVIVFEVELVGLEAFVKLSRSPETLRSDSSHKTKKHRHGFIDKVMGMNKVSCIFETWMV